MWLAGGAIYSHGTEQNNQGIKPFDGMTRRFEPRLVLSLAVGGIGFYRDLVKSGKKTIE